MYGNTTLLPGIAPVRPECRGWSEARAVLPGSAPRVSPAAAHTLVRTATSADLDAIRRIYNEGIADRNGTLDEEAKSEVEIGEWYRAHDDRYRVFAAERAGCVAGWAALNRYSHRCAYRGVGDLSVYVAREARGTGVGTALLQAIESHATSYRFHKIVLFALAENRAGHALYAKLGYRDVGTFLEQGCIDGRFVDVIAMEKRLHGAKRD